MRRTVDRKAAEAHPYLIWNAFVNLVAMEEYASLSAVQRQGHLVFWYDSEVQNGGHLQFFLNRGTDLVEETLASLRANGLPCHASVLRRAAEAWLASERLARIPSRSMWKSPSRTNSGSSTRRSMDAVLTFTKHSNATWSDIATSMWLWRKADG